MMSTDRLTVRVVVFTLAGVVIGGAASMVFLTATHTTIPDALDRLVSIALGAIAGLLAKTSTADAPQDVTVVNPADAPVPVDANL